MKLYIKGERRYSEATRDEVLREASRILREFDPEMASEILGLAKGISAFDSKLTIAEAKLIDSAMREQKAIDKTFTK